ncbi:hypothetical protein ABW20_dc0110344 [Dactylellina cionopaga]|nr:hypothetical protein ABW20_dc0110344 [Dactylellina cionopaga]
MALLVLHLLIELIKILGTPLTDLSRFESIVKLVAPFTFLWGLACYCSEENRRETLKVFSPFIPRTLDFMLRSVFTMVENSISIVIAPLALCWRLLSTSATWMSRIWTSIRDSFIEAFGLNENNLALEVFELLVTCLYVVSGIVLLLVLVVVQNIGKIYDFYVAFRYWRARAAGEIWCFFHPLPPVRKDFIRRPHRRNPVNEDQHLTGKSEELKVVSSPVSGRRDKGKHRVTSSGIKPSGFTHCPEPGSTTSSERLTPAQALAFLQLKHKPPRRWGFATGQQPPVLSNCPSQPQHLKLVFTPSSQSYGFNPTGTGFGSGHATLPK